jgi:Zn-dependent peptidase ImmA (M78 family)
LQRRFGLESTSQWAEWAAGQLLRETQQLAVPVDLAPMLLARKATAVVFDENLLCEARLERAATGFSIRLRGSLAQGENERHRRFALAHELGHTLFYDLDEIPLRRTIALPLHDPLEEELCDKFAAALLIPHWYLNGIRHELAPNAGGQTLLEKVCAECGVPPQFVAPRLNQSMPEMDICQ